MKQVVLIGDLALWNREAEFISDLLTYTGVQALTVNLGARGGAWDMNSGDIQKVFPAETFPQSAALLARKLYSQGLLDGLMGLADSETAPILKACLETIPFGVPKLGIVPWGMQPQWQSPSDCINIWLPGSSSSFNTMVKITISNAVFGLSGMMLNSIYNYGSSRAQVAVVAETRAGQTIGAWLTDNSIDYLVFSHSDSCLKGLVRDGYIHGLLVCSDLDDKLICCLEAACERDTPVVLVQQDYPPILPSSMPAQAKLTLVRSRVQSPPDREYLRLHTVSYSPGSDRLLQAAAKTLAALLK